MRGCYGVRGCVRVCYGVRGSLTSALVPFPRSNSGGERGCYGVRKGLEGCINVLLLR